MWVVGTSHTGALKEAAPESLKPRIIHMREAAVVGPRDVKYRYAFLTALRADDAAIFSMIGGNAHNVLGLVRHPRPFDFIHPQHADLPLEEDAELIPFTAMRDALKRMSTRWLNGLSALARRFPGRVRHLESPPQARDQTFIKNDIREKMATQGISDYSIAAPALRYKLWRLNSEIFASVCKESGVAFIPAPADSMDADGFLLPQYLDNATHANAAYGQLCLDLMEAHRS